MRPRTRTPLVVLVTATVAVLFTPTPSFADEVRDDQWYLDDLKIDKVHKLSQGKGVTVGVIDSGIDATHPDLKGNIKAGKDYGTSKDKGLHDARDHGTSTASILVGHGHGADGSEGILGIAPKAKAISVGVDWDKPNSETSDYISEAIFWLVDQDVDVISVSMGGGQTNNESLEYARDNGVQVVGSIGNTKEVDPILGEYKNFNGSWPAIGANAIPVSGTNEKGEFWSGSVKLVDAAPQPQLGLSAPAENLKTASPGGGYAAHSGTSGSAPIVAGTVALIKSTYPDLSWEQVNERLVSTTDDKGPKGFDNEYGWGIVNPYRALTEDVKHFKGGTSTKADAVPLNQQGKASEEDDTQEGDESALTPAGSESLLLMISVGATAAAIAAVGISIIVARGRRAKVRSAASKKS